MSWLGLTSYDLSAAAWTILVGSLCNATCGLLGCYLVLRRLSLLGDAISHAVLPGIVIGFLLSGSLGFLPVFLGAMAVGVLTAFLTQTLKSFGNVPEDAGMGVVFTSLFALGVLLLTNFARQVDLDPGCVLYGLIEFVPLDTVPILGWEVPRALGPLGVSLIATGSFVGLFWKELKIASFDPQLATSMGINAMVVHYLLMGMVAGVTVAAFESVGSILVIAMLIVPGATAHLLTDRLGLMMFWAVVVGIVAAVFGYLGAVVWNTSVAGMMAVVVGGEFALAVIAAPRHGLLAKALRNLSLSLRIVGEDILARLYRLEEAAGGRVSTTSEEVRVFAGRSTRWLATALLRGRGDVVRAAFGRLELTDSGRERARSLVRAHRLWEAYLGEHFDLPLDHLHEPAERVEHFLDPTLQAKLEAELRNPNRDPHGRVIPPANPAEN